MYTIIFARYLLDLFIFFDKYFKENFKEFEASLRFRTQYAVYICCHITTHHLIEYDHINLKSNEGSAVR